MSTSYPGLRAALKIVRAEQLGRVIDALLDEMAANR